MVASAGLALGWKIVSSAQAFFGKTTEAGRLDGYDVKILPVKEDELAIENKRAPCETWHPHRIGVKELTFLQGLELPDQSALDAFKQSIGVYCAAVENTRKGTVDGGNKEHKFIYQFPVEFSLYHGEGTFLFKNGMLILPESGCSGFYPLVLRREYVVGQMARFPDVYALFALGESGEAKLDLCYSFEKENQRYVLSLVCKSYALETPVEMELVSFPEATVEAFQSPNRNPSHSESVELFLFLFVVFYTSGSKDIGLPNPEKIIALTPHHNTLKLFRDVANIPLYFLLPMLKKGEMLKVDRFPVMKVDFSSKFRRNPSLVMKELRRGCSEMVIEREAKQAPFIPLSVPKQRSPSLTTDDAKEKVKPFCNLYEFFLSLIILNYGMRYEQAASIAIHLFGISHPLALVNALTSDVEVAGQLVKAMQKGLSVLSTTELIDQFLKSDVAKEMDVLENEITEVEEVIKGDRSFGIQEIGEKAPLEQLYHRWERVDDKTCNSVLTDPSEALHQLKARYYVYQRKDKKVDSAILWRDLVQLPLKKMCSSRLREGSGWEERAICCLGLAALTSNEAKKKRYFRFFEQAFQGLDEEQALEVLAFVRHIPGMYTLLHPLFLRLIQEASKDIAANILDYSKQQPLGKECQDLLRVGLRAFSPEVQLMCARRKEAALSLKEKVWFIKDFEWQNIEEEAECLVEWLREEKNPDTLISALVEVSKGKTLWELLTSSFLAVQQVPESLLQVTLSTRGILVMVAKGALKRRSDLFFALLDELKKNDSYLHSLLRLMTRHQNDLVDKLSAAIQRGEEKEALLARIAESQPGSEFKLFLLHVILYAYAQDSRVYEQLMSLYREDQVPFSLLIELFERGDWKKEKQEDYQQCIGLRALTHPSCSVLRRVAQNILPVKQWLNNEGSIRVDKTAPVSLQLMATDVDLECVDATSLKHPIYRRLLPRMPDRVKVRILSNVEGCPKLSEEKSFGELMKGGEVLKFFVKNAHDKHLENFVAITLATHCEHMTWSHIEGLLNNRAFVALEQIAAVCNKLAQAPSASQINNITLPAECPASIVLFIFGLTQIHEVAFEGLSEGPIKRLCEIYRSKDDEAQCNAKVDMKVEVQVRLFLDKCVKAEWQSEKTYRDLFCLCSHQNQSIANSAMVKLGELCKEAGREKKSLKCCLTMMMKLPESKVALGHRFGFEPHDPVLLQVVREILEEEIITGERNALLKILLLNTRPPAFPKKAVSPKALEIPTTLFPKKLEGGYTVSKEVLSPFHAIFGSIKKSDFGERLFSQESRFHGELIHYFLGYAKTLLTLGQADPQDNQKKWVARLFDDVPGVSGVLGQIAVIHYELQRYQEMNKKESTNFTKRWMNRSIADLKQKLREVTSRLLGLKVFMGKFYDTLDSSQVVGAELKCGAAELRLFAKTFNLQIAIYNQEEGAVVLERTYNDSGKHSIAFLKQELKYSRMSIDKCVDESAFELESLPKEALFTRQYFRTISKDENNAYQGGL